MSSLDARALDAAAIDREMVRRKGLYEFVKRAWPQVEPAVPYQDNWHIGAICEHLTAVTLGQIRWLVINIPPGCMKSRLTGLFWPVWDWICDPSQRLGFWSFDGTLTAREARHSLELIQSDWFQPRWGDRVQLKETSPAVGEYWTTMGGLRFSNSVGGGATGWHLNKQVWDDTNKIKGLSKVTLEETQKWEAGVMSTRWANPATAARVIVQQRVHHEDSSGNALKDPKYVHLFLPMRFESGRRCVTTWSLPSGEVKTWQDPRTVDGELLWPKRWTADAVKEAVNGLGGEGSPGDAGQMQQRPTAEGGEIFKEEWDRTWVEPGSPTDHLKPGTWKERPGRFDEIILSVDCAFKDADSSDYVVIQTWGRHGPDFYLLEEVRERLSFTATCDAIRAASTSTWGRFALAKLVEDKANGTAVIDTLVRELPGIVPVEPLGGKVVRAQAATPAFRSGNVYDPDPMTHPWVHTTRQERHQFPRAKNDDTVDATSQAIAYLVQQFREFGSAMKALESKDGAGIMSALLGMNPAQLITRR